MNATMLDGRTVPTDSPEWRQECLERDNQARAILRLPFSERRETLARLQAQHGPEYVGRLKARITAIWEASRCA